MLSSEKQRHEDPAASPRTLRRAAFSLARVVSFPYNPVDFADPVDLQGCCGPEFGRLPELNLVQEAGK